MGNTKNKTELKPELQTAESHSVNTLKINDRTSGGAYTEIPKFDEGSKQQGYNPYLKSLLLALLIAGSGYGAYKYFSKTQSDIRTPSSVTATQEKRATLTVSPEDLDLKTTEEVKRDLLAGKKVDLIQIRSATSYDVDPATKSGAQQGANQQNQLAPQQQNKDGSKADDVSSQQPDSSQQANIQQQPDVQAATDLQSQQGQIQQQLVDQVKANNPALQQAQATVTAQQQQPRTIGYHPGMSQAEMDKVGVGYRPKAPERLPASPQPTLIVDKIMSGEMQYYSFQIFDSAWEDGDVVEISIDGQSIGYVDMSNTGLTISVPLEPGKSHVMTVRGVRDGGGGITFGAQLMNSNIMFDWFAPGDTRYIDLRFTK